MTREQVLDAVQKGQYAKSLRQKLHSKVIIVSLSRSRCCGAFSLLVGSRQGGFISQDCLQCGNRSAHVGSMDIPDLDCDDCQAAGVIVVRVLYDDYWYECTSCRNRWRLFDILPFWSELFEYSGLGAPGDPSYWT